MILSNTAIHQALDEDRLVIDRNRRPEIAVKVRTVPSKRRPSTYGLLQRFRISGRTFLLTLTCVAAVLLDSSAPTPKPTN